MEKEQVWKGITGRNYWVREDGYCTLRKESKQEQGSQIIRGEEGMEGEAVVCG